MVRRGSCAGSQIVESPALQATLLKFQKKIDLPMLFLSFAWLLILIAELVIGMNAVLHYVGTGIWLVFIFYFAIRLITAPKRRNFLRKNWLFVLAMLVSVMRLFPFLEPFPAVRALTATFGMQVIWIFASADQGMRSIRRTLGKRGVGYALVFTLVVVFAGAAGIFHFERVTGNSEGIQTYPKALWWTAMQMTNIGSTYSIQTSGGRVLSLGISIYAAAMFGYLTALFATFLIDRDVKDPKPELDRQKSIQKILEEIGQLKATLDEVLIRISPDHSKKAALKLEAYKSVPNSDGFHSKPVASK